MTNLESIFKSRDITLPAKVCLVKAMVFSSGHVWLWEWTIKKAEHRKIEAFELWCWRSLLRVPWTARRYDQSILMEISSEMFIGRSDVAAETPMLWWPEVNNWLIRKDPDSGKNWRWDEKGMTEDEMVGWRRWLNGCDFEQTPGAGDAQGSLVYCSPWGCKESDLTEWLNWTELNWILLRSIGLMFS